LPGSGKQDRLRGHFPKSPGRILGPAAGQAGYSVRAECPGCRTGGNLASRTQNRVRSGQFMRGRPDVHPGIVEHQVLDMYQLSRKPQRVARLNEMRPRYPAFIFAQKTITRPATVNYAIIILSPHPVIQTRQGILGRNDRLQKGVQGQKGRIISHWLYGK
ncbi:MAG: hypothetical protein ACRECY_19560, partial [Phyllobacterium sp.]